MKLYGLIGHPLKHSFSAQLFNGKFQHEQLDCRYRNFELKSLDQLKALLESHTELCGLNVTVPFKEAIIPLLDELDPLAKEIGAVNTVTVNDGKLVGYNTDVMGFERLLATALKDRNISHALVLGTGGASKAVQYVLRQKQIPFALVSRSADKGDYSYDTLTDEMLRHSHLIINATPVGMYPHLDEFPEIHYHVLGKQHILIDLIYNPKETAFMILGKDWGVKAYNGMTMLEEQARQAWEIFKQATTYK